jgi:hypothetical protein
MFQLQMIKIIMRELEPKEQLVLHTRRLYTVKYIAKVLVVLTCSIFLALIESHSRYSN